MGNTVLSLITAAYELDEKLDSLYTSRSFIQSIIYEAHTRDDKALYDEFTAKLAETEKEISKLIGEA
jgi:hypothetical protein